MQSLEYLEQKRKDLRADLENTLKGAREHIASEETALREKQSALNDFVKNSQRRVSQLEGAIMGLNEALASPTAPPEGGAEKGKPDPVKPDSAVKPDAPTPTPSQPV